MITLDLIAGQVGVGSAEKRNHINWCEKKEPSGSDRRTWPLGLSGGAMNGDPVHLDSTSLRLPPPRRHMHLDSLTSACQFSCLFDMWSWLIPAFPCCCKADLRLQGPLGPLTESGAHVGPACQAGGCPWSPDYPAHCHRPAVSWPQRVLSRGIRAATPVSASDGNSWAAVAGVSLYLWPTEGVEVGVCPFPSSSEVLAVSWVCVCVFHMRTHCQRHSPQVVPSSLSSFACHPAVTLPAAPTLQPHSPSCEEGRKEGGPKCRVRWEPLKSSVPRTVASARTAHRLICKSIREVPRTIWRKTAPFLPGQSQRQSRDHSGIMWALKSEDGPLWWPGASLEKRCQDFLTRCCRSAMSDYLPPCGLQPTRLLCPWDSPGKNTGVDCHFLLQGIFPTQGLSLRLLHLLLWQAASWATALLRTLSLFLLSFFKHGHKCDTGTR